MINRNLFTAIFSILVLLFLFQFGCRSNITVPDDSVTSRTATSIPIYTASEQSPFLQNPIREFRAAWVATVANIDWPSVPGLSVDQQKREMVALMNRAAALHLNAIIFQVRPAADALYNSPYEPWSSYLTGTMGQPPLPFYDPLEFAIQEAHKRGLELHAWFNPYRAGHPTNRSSYSSDHISRTNPEYVHHYGEFLWLDPGIPEVKQHTIDVIMDVVERYDIDGVHFDDYFYPYPSYADDADFPDSLSWRRAIDAGSTLSRGDWRRENVNSLMKELSQQIREMKPHVKFGISPFGVWRPGYPAHTTGFDAYEQLYADAKLWINEGWVDYFTPQIYYQMDQVSQPFPIMLNWWAEQNLFQRHIWPGLFTSRLRTADRIWPSEEIKGQIYTARAFPQVTGVVHFSMKAFLENSKNINRIVSAGAYSNPALIPASPWMGSESIPAPDFNIRDYGDYWRATFRADENIPVKWWVMRTQYNGRWEAQVIPGHHHVVSHYGGTAMVRPKSVYLTAVGRTGMESEPAEFHFQQNYMAAEITNLDSVTIIRRTQWSDRRPAGYEANAIRRNIASRDTLRFQDLTLIVEQMMRSAPMPGHLLKFDPGDELDGDGYSETALIKVYKNGVTETLSVNPGESLNWYGYHISLLQMDFQEIVSHFEIATVGSLPVNRAAMLETGDGTMRLRVKHNVENIAITRQAAEPADSVEWDTTQDYLNSLFKRSVEKDNRWDLPHHYYIDSDGEIFEGRNAGYAGEADADFDPRGFLIIHLIAATDDPADSIPVMQRDALAHLSNYLLDKHGFDIDQIYLLSDLDRGVDGDLLRYNEELSSSLLNQIRQKN